MNTEHSDTTSHPEPRPGATPGPIEVPAPHARHGGPGDHAGHPHHTEPVVDDGPTQEAPLPEPTHAGAEGDSETFDTSRTFADIGLRNSVMKGIEACGFKYPTKTQGALIPAIMAGKDVLGQAKTGTGKTAAFALPLLHMLGRETPFQALILAPTRELAIQITGEIEDLGSHTPIRAVTVYGGQAVRTQADKLQRGAQIIVGTPGRIMDMLERGHLHFGNITHVVLDEVDRMLDIGFRDDIRKILEQVPGPRQTVFVSATISPEIERLARKHMRGDAEKIIVHSGSLTVNLVRQHYLPVNPWDKKRLLLHLLRHEEPALTVVFCRLKRHVDEIARGLSARGIEAHAIHGDMSQGKRNTTMKRLRDGHLSVLVASDLASRGLDVEGITHVINYDLPEDPEVYVHRIGRTARAGRGGVAWSLVTPEQGDLLTEIEKLINAEVPRLDYPDFTPSDTPPQGYRAPVDSRSQGLSVVHAGGEAPKPPEAPKAVNRLEASKPTLDNVEAVRADPSKFPGGIVPTKLPPKLLVRGVKRR
jgi:ATP-dependent RNA helicase DeaD